MIEPCKPVDVPAERAKFLFRSSQVLGKGQRLGGALPCVLLTASEDESAQVRALDAGADAFVRKDDDMDIILARIGAVMRRRADLPLNKIASLSGPRKILAVDDSDAFDLGSHQLRFLITPYVHQWDSMLAYDATTRTVFCSDVFISLGEGPAVTDRDESDAMLDAYRMIGIFPSKRHLDAALDKIEATEPATLACHHGSVKGGQGVAGYLHAMRENDLTGLTEWNPMAEAR